MQFLLINYLQLPTQTSNLCIGFHILLPLGRRNKPVPPGPVTRNLRSQRKRSFLSRFPNLSPQTWSFRFPQLGLSGHLDTHGRRWFRLLSFLGLFLFPVSFHLLNALIPPKAVRVVCQTHQRLKRLLLGLGQRLAGLYRFQLLDQPEIVVGGKGAI